MRLQSQVIVSSDLVQSIYRLESLLKEEQLIEIVSPTIMKLLTPDETTAIDSRIGRIVTAKESFTVEDAKVVIEKAYIASDTPTTLLLVATHFSDVVQNRLLKVIEEPPQNKEFILLIEQKSTLLDTIKSRLPIVIDKQKGLEESSLGLNLSTLSLESLYLFVQKHKQTSSQTMKPIIEAIVTQAIISQRYDLKKGALTLCSNAVLALNMGSPPQFVLSTLLLKLLADKKE